MENDILQSILIFAKINNGYLFYNSDKFPDPVHNFYVAVRNVATEDFAVFVTSYNFFDWVDEYESAGVFLTEVFWNPFDELIEEESE